MTHAAAADHAAELRALVAAELSLPVDPRARAVGEAIAALYPGAARAVLFYGSCLRAAMLDGLMLDFYLIVSDYEAAFGRGWYAVANRLLPPNVFPFEHGGLAAKYAVLSEADFAALNSPDAGSVSVWARFAQPARLVWAADATARDRAVAAVAGAALALFTLTLPVVGAQADDHAVWTQGFALTYAAELRAERGSRPADIVAADPDRFARIGKAARAIASAGPLLPPASAARRWRRMQRRGKLLTLARLAKATTTFAGGIDYIAWKINRHAGTAIAIRPWQRRWPILGGISLLPRLLRRGAVR